MVKQPVCNREQWTPGGGVLYPENRDPQNKIRINFIGFVLQLYFSFAQIFLFLWAFNNPKNRKPYFNSHMSVLK